MRSPLLRTVLSSLLLAAPLALAAQAPPPAQDLGKGVGDLMLLPTRVVLEGRVRAAEVTLKNVGSDKATYRIGFQEMEMTPEGQLREHAKAPGEITAADLIRFSPHQVDLAPGESQIVRIQVRKPENLPDGEYRSHLVFNAVPPVEPPSSTDAAGDAKQISIVIKAIYGISIPVIVRSGETSATVALANATFQPAPQEGWLSSVAMDLQRTGNRSVMGDFDAIVEAGGPLKPGTIVGFAKGLAVYQNLAYRKVQVALNPDKDVNLKGTRLKIRFTPKDVKMDPVETSVVVP